MVLENQEGKKASYAVVAVVCLQDNTHGRSLLPPWVRAVRTEEQGETLDATWSILGEIEGKGWMTY